MDIEKMAASGSGGEKTGGASARASGPLGGVVDAPGDKSISHRSLIFGALAAGTTRVDGLLEGDDVLRTAAAMRALGASVERDGPQWRVEGRPWAAPNRALYFGNSGTGARLVMGAVAGAGIAAAFDGDRSLRSRPMGRVLEPLRMMGVEAVSRDGRLPVEIAPNQGLKAVNVKLATPSAQVKSAILLAALGATGTARIHEPQLCRDHTERMLASFGVKLDFEGDGAGGRFIIMDGGQKLTGRQVCVPGDPSSAAFLVAAGAITPNSEVVIKNVLINPLRAGFFATLREMGAAITFENEREESGEPVADIRVRHSVLRGVDVRAERAPSMIDEYPILAVVAAFAHGKTRLNGLEELRVKESDRLAAIEAGLVANGVDVRSGKDWLEVTGGAVAGGGRVKTHDDHRIAMSFLIMGLGAEQPIEVDDAAMIATSFPNFFDIMKELGGDIIRG